MNQEADNAYIRNFKENAMNKRIISGLTALVLFIGIFVGSGIAARAEDKKIVSISAEYTNGAKLNEDKELLTGKSIEKGDFKIKAKYNDNSEAELSNDEVANNITLSHSTVPFNTGRSLTVTVTYNKTDNTDDGHVKTANVVIMVTHDVIERIEASWTGASEYYIGDQIKKGEITLQAVYKTYDASGNTSSKSTTIRPNYFTIEPETIKADGINNITVTYGKMTTVAQVKGYGPKALTVTYSGDKSIVVGGKVDDKKIKVEMLYTNGKTKKIDIKNCTVTGLDVNIAGPVEVTVQYLGYFARFTVTGIAKAPEKISAKYNGEELSVGSTIDITKISVTVTYNDKTKDVISSGFTISPTKVTQVGTNTITVTYNGYSDTINIKATEIMPTSITAIYNGGTVIEGSQVNKSSITVTAYYPNGTTKQVTDFELSAETMNTVGMQEVIVKYKKLTATIYVPVTAKMVTSITAVYNGGSVIQNNSIDRSKIVVTATYNDGTTSNVSDYILSSTVATKLGVNEFIINYGGRTAKLLVTATPRIISGRGTLKGEVSDGDYSSSITAYIQDQFVGENIKLETEDVEGATLSKVVRRVNKTKKYLGFALEVESFQFDENKYMITEVTIPEGFDAARVAVYYTPDRKKVMVQMPGGLVSKTTYRFYLYRSGTYIIMEKEDNDIGKQELRESETRTPFLVASTPSRMKIGDKAKIKPYILFSTINNDGFKYEVSDDDVLSVSENGDIKAKSEGTATITVTAKTGSYSESYDIEVEGN